MDVKELIEIKGQLLVVFQNLEEVESEELLLGVGVDRRQAEHQDAGQDQDGVVAGLKMVGIRKLDEHDKR